MKKVLAIAASLCFISSLHAADPFKASKETALRAPSVPLITSDTYFSIWSPYTELTEGNTEHWTAAEHPLLGAVRVDGKVYRFMGKDKLALSPIVPMTDDTQWEAHYTFHAPQEAWTSINYDDSSWQRGKAAFGTRDMPRIATEWNTPQPVRELFFAFLLLCHSELCEESVNAKWVYSDSSLTFRMTK